MTLEGYLSSAGKDEQAFRAELRPRAERRVRVRILLETLSERASIDVSEEEMAKEVQNLAAELRQDVPKVEAWLAERGRREGLRDTLVRRKAIALLVDAVAGPESNAASAGSPGASAAAAEGSAEQAGAPGPGENPATDA
jgi:FKBP-type peptidyl-prolyl cis-trans isomerase (trigger factor)